MGKPGPTSDRSCSGALSRHIVHRVAVYSGHGSAANYDNVLPKMAKQDFAFSASTNTRFLDWKAAQLAYYNHPNNHSRDRCPQLWSTDLENNPLFGHECHAMPLCPNGGCKQCGGVRPIYAPGWFPGQGAIIGEEFNGEGYCVGKGAAPHTKKYACMQLNLAWCSCPDAQALIAKYPPKNDIDPDPGRAQSMCAKCPTFGAYPNGCATSPGHACCQFAAAEWDVAAAAVAAATLRGEACGAGQKGGHRCRTFPIECDNAATNVGKSC